MYPQVFGKYVLERELARGGMARVLLATLRGAGGFEKKLVVKQIRDDLASDEEFVRRFVEEAKTTVALVHPNIVPVYELGVEMGTYFLAMEYVAGASLSELLRARARAGGGGLTPEEGAYVGVEVCRALDYAHRRMKVVHRDVTPRNVMVDEEGQVKVIDFGISAPAATAPTGEGVFGSPGHMPPEQMAGSQLTPAADVFAVSALLMELWSGQPPFRRRTLEEIEAALRAPHPRPSDVDIRLLPLDGVVLRALSLDPEARPQQADELARSLRRFLSEVDLGDLARQLGERVRAVRENPPPPSALRGPTLQRPPSRPTGVPVGTKTFAARDDVNAWDGSPEGAPAAGTGAAPSSDTATGPSTRKLASLPPEGTGGSARRTNRASRRLAWRAAAGAAAVAVVAFFLGRGAATPAASTALTDPARLPASDPPPAPPAGSAGPAAIVARPRAGGPVESGSSAPPSPAAPAPAASSASLAPTDAPAPEAEAQLSLLGSGTHVTVDGVARGLAPARLSLAAGPHAVVFTFPATGESKAATVTLKPGEHARLRADFTGARPTIRVER